MNKIFMVMRMLLRDMMVVIGQFILLAVVLAIMVVIAILVPSAIIGYITYIFGFGGVDWGLNEYLSHGMYVGMGIFWIIFIVYNLIMMIISSIKNAIEKVKNELKYDI